MCIFEYNEELHIKNERNIAREDGIRQGRKQGLKKGRKQGLERGLKRGLERGRKQTLTNLICKKLIKNKSIEQISDELETDIGTVTEICNIAKRYAPDYDAEKILAELVAGEP